ncbi:hypothetical protein JOC86_000579 [Bacillus pakistanensis]|uniref:Holin n=1 Tax=Rossellomorea pakistanensis TaxID=992288 RepID=A0ABS2N860_9BACI|nr:phage holin family protein [Bacillus pakistanensis]MBM7584042.1 hypothetical protein [Bacillus pakistanensis]
MIETYLNQVKIDPQIAILVPALMVLGYALKRTPHVQDWLIIWVLIVFGVLASGWKLGFEFNGIANGFIAAGAAITTHQSIKQTFIERKNDRKKQN